MEVTEKRERHGSREREEKQGATTKRNAQILKEKVKRGQERMLQRVVNARENIERDEGKWH